MNIILIFKIIDILEFQNIFQYIYHYYKQGSEFSACSKKAPAKHHLSLNFGKRLSANHAQQKVSGAHKIAFI